MARVRGTRELRAALRNAPAHLREEAVEEVRASSKRMHDDAKQRFKTASSYATFWHGGVGMQRITGTIQRLYRYSVSKKQMRGRVGILSAASARKAFYLKFFLFGTSNQPARNVHDDAFEAERDVYIEKQGNALQRVLRKL